jgi:hypothetical protein
MYTSSLELDEQIKTAVHLYILKRGVLKFLLLVLFILVCLCMCVHQEGLHDYSKLLEGVAELERLTNEQVRTDYFHIHSISTHLL